LFLFNQNFLAKRSTRINLFQVESFAVRLSQKDSLRVLDPIRTLFLPVLCEQKRILLHEDREMEPPPWTAMPKRPDEVLLPYTTPPSSLQLCSIVGTPDEMNQKEMEHKLKK
jgi:hypothetical protein